MENILSESERKWPLADAWMIAQRSVMLLMPLCQRVEIAGSIRRRKSEVGDIEIVCVPMTIGGLFRDQPAYIPPLGQVVKDGDRYKQYILGEGIKLDLYFVLPPGEWGVIFTIRTGGAKFSRMVVTQRNKGGWLPSDMEVRDGALWQGDKFIPTPEEFDFFREIRLKWVPPPNRG